MNRLREHSEKYLGVLGVLFWLIVLVPPIGGEEPRKVSLEPLHPDSVAVNIPDLGSALHPPGVLLIPEPEKLQKVSIHIPVLRSRKIFSKINTIAMGPVHDQRQRRDELVYNIDLRRNLSSHFSFIPEANTLEVTIFPKDREKAPILARWVIAPPRDPNGWQSRELVSVSTAAALSTDGLQILELLPDGTRTPIQHGLTASRDVLVSAEFTALDASIGLRVRHQGAEGSSRILTDGRSRAGDGRGVLPTAPEAHSLEVPVELDLGANVLEAEILHGDTVLYRGRYEILHRRPSLPGNVDGDRWAFVVGISEYRDESVSDLLYAHRDAEELGKLLVSRGHFAPERVRVLTDADATGEGIRSGLHHFLNKSRPEDLVVIFIAGHGVFDPEDPDNFYFLAHDSKVANLGGTAVPMWAIGNAMGHTIRARQIMVIADACHSGGMLHYDSVDGTGLNFINKYLETLARTKGRFVLTAAQAHETSLEKDELRHGAFTHHILEGLRGAADTDRDRVVTVQEVADYLKKAVPVETQGRQHPTYRESQFDTGLSLSFLEAPQQQGLTPTPTTKR